MKEYEQIKQEKEEKEEKTGWLIAELFGYISHSISIKTEKFSISLDKDETNIAM
jgi:hypothetical protein